MYKPRPCGCKGIRTCFVCEQDAEVRELANSKPFLYIDPQSCMEYCHFCGKAFEGSDVALNHPGHDEKQPFEFPGVFLQENFITVSEENDLVSGCDSLTWDLSQSGRRKQNFGPKTNFKKKKIQCGDFKGFPSFSQFVQERFKSVKILEDFKTVEQCAIEYTPETGAHIDPHIDDCWIWGERVVSVNLLSDSYLTLTKYNGDVSKYNLDYYYANVCQFDQFETKESHKKFPHVRIPMPARSLLVLYGPARYEWEHCVARCDIKKRRICLAYREFTSSYLSDGKHFSQTGCNILNKASKFWS